MMNFKDLALIVCILLLIGLFGYSILLDVERDNNEVQVQSKQAQVDVSEVTYQWTDKGIKTSDNRFFVLKRENLVDEKGNPIVIIEARTDPNAVQLNRSNMNVDQLMYDFWLRVADQDLDTLHFVPSKFDNVGDLRRVFVTVTKEEADFLQIDKKYRFDLKIPGYNKTLIAIWQILKHQEKLQEVPVPSELFNKVKSLRDTEKPSE